MSVTIRDKLTMLYEAAMFRPLLGITIVLLSFCTALLEGAGLGFLLPIIEITQSTSPPTNADGFLGLFVQVYSFIGVPFTLEYLILGVGSVMTIRFGLSFISAWLRAILGLSYQRYLRFEYFNSLMYSPVEYIDRSGSDQLLNILITETNRASGVAMAVFSLVEVILRGVVYLVIAALLSPVLTGAALVGLGMSTLFVRYILEPAYAVGDEIAKANDRIQSVSQTSIQGMRDVRLFNMREEISQQMQEVLDRHLSTGVRLNRNQAGLRNLNKLTNALVVFGLVYGGIRFTGLSLAELGVFLFAVFRLSPVVNQINDSVYGLEGQLPHLVRIRSGIAELKRLMRKEDTGGRDIQSVDSVVFEDVSFSYGSEDVLRNVSLSVERGEQIALIGPSGAGKSTVVALLARFESPDSGEILIDARPVEYIDIKQWRQRIAVVRQDPYVFNTTLRENITIGNRDATKKTVKRACKVACVSKFLSELPDGYDTELGEDGVRLSGGQKQRVAIARALIKDADVLVLDEATSELDSSIERDVYNRIQSLEDEYLTISIAHRLSTVNDADRIYTLDDGEITEVGTHEELLADEGTYAELYGIQS